jgi:hypothetical protein
MNVLERIEQGKLIAAVWPFGKDFTTEESRKMRDDLLKLAKLGQQMQWFTEHCPDDYGLLTDGVCPADRDCAKCWATIFESMPEPGEGE